MPEQQSRHHHERSPEDTMDGDDEDSGDSEETESVSRKQRRKNGKGKLDRSKLRKGKWTVRKATVLMSGFKI